MAVTRARLDCGHRLSPAELVGGLCPKCLLGLALTVHSDGEDAALDSALPTLDSPSTSQLGPTGPSATERQLGANGGGETFSSGQLLGDRYRIESLLGRGGMGEVWRAYDLKLRLEVALKSLQPKLFETEDALELLRDEVRAAREVTSPNVCRLYDLVEVGDRELVSMEYVDGVTLVAHLKKHGPLQLREANEVASQLLAGLESVHEAGLVHRDIKPENVMLTRTGRVVLMDFGLTSPSGTGSIGGTPAYMPPEQARGEVTDARADVFAAGMVLAEMISAERGPDESSRQSFWEAIREEPPRLPESPWKPILTRAVSPDVAVRHATAAELARALEEVAFRIEGVEVEHPYPGLAPFQKEDAEFFFGREAEVEAVWKRLQQAHLLGLIGPSGSGKSSFLNAGLLPAAPEGWCCLHMTPSVDPFTALGRVLLSDLDTDAAALRLLTCLEGPEPALEVLRQQRAQHPELLIVVDQFEELFTQNGKDLQRRFAELLGRAALDADVHVLLSMRDDYLFQCQAFGALRPLFSELTPLGSPTGASLRRAIVQPALRCGYRFEDESIVEAMLEEVSKERGALPLIAFTAAQLWERRDRETGFLTVKAYEAIGGVGGALAQHAEAVLDYVGEANVEIVREIFRNLVTAEGTRASRDREGLLSVFVFNEGQPLVEPSRVHLNPPPEGPAASDILNTLVDARLLTSYEVPRDEGEPSRHRVELVHESLLVAWPRLVRWRMQDAEGVKLRDELRAQARLWDQHDRADDYLWTGAAYLDYLAWRERYPGGLTSTEAAFTRAMTAHAERRKRRRRMAAAAAFIVLVAVLSLVTWSRFEAVAEARRAEAAKLIAIAQLQLETDPTEALAYSMASLELADTPEARDFVMQALWAGPPALVAESGTAENHFAPRFSPDGRWLSWAPIGAPTVLVWHQDGSGPAVLDGHPASRWWWIQTGWISDHELVTGHPTEGRVRLWSFPGAELRREIEFGSITFWDASAGWLGAQVLPPDATTDTGSYDLRSWRLPDGEAEDHGRADLRELGVTVARGFDPSGRGWLYVKGNQIFYRALPVEEGAEDRLVARHENAIGGYWDPREPDRLWTRDAVTGELRLWDLQASRVEPLKVVERPAGLAEGIEIAPAVEGRWLYDDKRRADSSVFRDGKVLLWDLSSLPGADPRVLKRSGRWFGLLDFHPTGDWFVAATENGTTLSFWPLKVPMPAVVSGYETTALQAVAFTPDSRWLVTYWGQDRLRLWPLPGSGSREVRELESPRGNRTRLTIDAAGQRAFATGYGRNLAIVPLAGEEPWLLEGFEPSTWVNEGAFSPSGRLLAAATLGATEERVLRVWDLETGEVRVFDLPPPMIGADGETANGGGGAGDWVWHLAFTDESTLLTLGNAGILRWDLESGTHQPIVSSEPPRFPDFRLSGDRRRLMTWMESECGSVELHDLATGQSRELRTFADRLDSCDGARVAVDETLSVLAIGRPDGTLLVGRLEGDSAHLLTGHRGPISDLAISPDGRWLASSGDDETLRLWPMPDLDKPPLHTLPHDELIAKLESLTNLRTVRDPESSTGWSIEIGPFPGWKEVPTW